jgi:hypothetical protein
MELNVLTAGLHSPMVAWNTKKRHIASQMTEAERVAIAKRATYNLRDRSPEIRRYLENISQIRLRFAKLLFTQELVSADLLCETEVTKYKRMARIADAQNKHHEDTAKFFQNETGFRVCCLGYIAGEDTLEQVEALLCDMETLAAQQEMLSKATLLSDLLSILIKRSSKYPDFDATTQGKKYEDVLVDYTRTLRQALEASSQTISGQSVAEYLQNQAEGQHLQTTDSRHKAMMSFSLTRACFEKLNQQIAEELAQIVEPTLRDRPELMLQAA